MTQIQRIAQRLLAVPEPPDTSASREFDGRPIFNADRPTVNAAVLIALVARAHGHTVLYTLRSEDLRAHSGQVAFPGGKIDESDADPAEAAFREAEEEVALRSSDARVIGFLPNYLTGSNYRITPVVAEVHPTAPFRPNPDEVAGLFEVPVAHLVDPAHYSRMTFKRGGVSRQTWRIDHAVHSIWGITANLTRSFRDTALAEGEPGNGGA